MRRFSLSFLVMVAVAMSSAQTFGQRGRATGPLTPGELSSGLAQQQSRRRGPTLSEDLKSAAASGQRVRVIVQGEEDALHSVRSRLGRGFRRDLAGALSLEVTANELRDLKADSGIAHISGDLPVIAHTSIANKITGAEKVWAGSRGLLGLLATPGYNGQGIGVAVIDSGIANHLALSGRVVARVNFVSNEPGASGDPFGHGTHIAGLIGGAVPTNTVGSPYMGGSAPGVHFVDVRVLGATGTGYTSDVIAGIDWTIANAQRYGVRVINLSLGHPASEPVSTDPLCRAVARAVEAGLTVVVSAGNNGRTRTGQPVLGGITSPGNSPLAITVGSVDTRGTLDRSDDRVAPYSSRGPAKLDANFADPASQTSLAIKPDVVAPGTGLVSLESAGSWLTTRNKTWRVGGLGRTAYYKMSGTSMSAAVVSGGVALLLDAQPGLSPAQVKMALQSGAQFLPDAGLIGGGAGSVDFPAALRITNQGLVGSLLTNITSLLGISGGASYRDQGTLTHRIYYDSGGIRLLNLLDLRNLFGNANNAEWGVLNLIGVTNPIAHTQPNYVVWGTTADWTSSYYVVWGTAMESPDGEYVVWGTAADEEYVVWGTGGDQ